MREPFAEFRHSCDVQDALSICVHAVPRQCDLDPGTEEKEKQSGGWGTDMGSAGSAAFSELGKKRILKPNLMKSHLSR